jgi:hypothetical protein
MAMVWAALVPRTAAQELAADPAAIEAAMLGSFARYVTWPSQATPTENSPWHVCVLGGDPFGDLLERALRGRTEQGHSFAIHRGRKLSDLPSCHIAFLAYDNPAQRRSTLASVKDEPILTVSDAPDFLREGGIVQLRRTDRIEIGLNLDQARAVSLKIQGRLLEVVPEVLEDGTLRRLR